MTGIPHPHSEHYDWCFRCQLSKDEAADIMREVAECVAQGHPLEPGAPGGFRNCFCLEVEVST